MEANNNNANKTNDESIDDTSKIDQSSFNWIISGCNSLICIAYVN